MLKDISHHTDSTKSIQLHLFQCALVTSLSSQPTGRGHRKGRQLGLFPGQATNCAVMRSGRPNIRRKIAIHVWVYTVGFLRMNQKWETYIAIHLYPLVVAFVCDDFDRFSLWCLHTPSRQDSLQATQAQQLPEHTEHEGTGLRRARKIHCVRRCVGLFLACFERIQLHTCMLAVRSPAIGCPLYSFIDWTF